MVCEDGHYNSFVLTLFNVGSIFGTPIYGMLSDKYEFSSLIYDNSFKNFLNFCFISEMTKGCFNTVQK